MNEPDQKIQRAWRKIEWLIPKNNPIGLVARAMGQSRSRRLDLPREFEKASVRVALASGKGMIHSH
jgi:hypothetical protein